MGASAPSLPQVPRLLGAILAAEPGTVYIFDLLANRLIHLSEPWLKNIGFTQEQLLQTPDPLSFLIHPDDLQRMRQSHQQWRSAPVEQLLHIEYRLRDAQGLWRWMISHEIGYARDSKGFTQILGIAHNKSREKRAESLLLAQIDTMEKMVAHQPLPQVLNCLVAAMEAQIPGVLGSILLMDRDNKIDHVAAPNLPQALIQALNGLSIGPSAGSCGTAIHRNEDVLVADIALDPLWDQYRHLVEPWGLRACWSSPIRNAQQRVIGSFAFYRTTPGLPPEELTNILHTATHLAAIAIEHRHMLNQYQLSEQRYRQLFEFAPEAMALVRESNFELLDINDNLCRLLGYERTALLGLTMPQILHSHHELNCMEACLRHQNLIECRLKQQGGSFFTGEISASAPYQGQRVVIIRDITERKQVDMRIRRLSQLYSALSECNQAIIRTRSMSELFPVLCRDAVQHGGMDLAWIGEIDHQTQRVNPVASYGRHADYVHGLTISIDPALVIGNGPVGQSYRSQKPIWCQDFLKAPGIEYWRERARIYGWGSCAVLPLWRGGKIQGFFLLYSHTVGILDDSVQTLLLEMASDVSFAWDNFDIQEDRRRAYVALEEREAHLRTILETQPECVQLVDANGHLLEVNRAGMTLLELDHPAQYEHQSWLRFVVPSDHTRALELHAQVMQGDMGRLEFTMVSAKDNLHDVETHAAPLRHASGEVRAMLAISRDLTERRSSLERIQYLANFDTLTGLPNRTYLEDHLRRTLHLARRSQDHLALLFIDLDNFKNINDSLGHFEGDQILRHVTQQMRYILRTEDLLARLGGDEFVLLISGTHAENTAQVANKLLESLGTPYWASHYELRMTASIGIALYPEDGDSLEELTRAADLAMYRAKQAGRNQFCFFTEDLHVAMVNNLKMVSALRNGLEHQAFHLVYQPKISLKDGHYTGLEALLRWRDPEMGDIPPSQFIPIAEDAGLILPLSEWVIRSVLTQLRRWKTDGRPLIPISVNVSAVQFRQTEFSDQLTDWLTEYGIEAQWLSLELVESLAMTDAKNAGAQLLRLHRQGHIISIDDFGTGYSSLSYLKRFPIHQLKIDQSFIRNIGFDANDCTIVTAIIDMAHHLGLTVLAEGVETEKQRDFLASHRCDEVQGYLYSRPVRIAELEILLDQASSPPPLT